MKGLANIIDLALQDNPQLHFKQAETFKRDIFAQTQLSF
jgi:hypothetical protein